MRNLLLVLPLAAERFRSLLRLPVTVVGTIALLIATTAAMSVGLLDLPDQEDRALRERNERAQAQAADFGFLTGRRTERGLRVIRPPNATAVLVGGQATILPAAWDMAPDGAVEREPYQFIHSRGRQDLTLPPETVIRVFGGLFALALGVSFALADVSRKWQAACAGWRVAPGMLLAADLAGVASALAVVVLAWFACVAAYLALVVSGSGQELWLDWLSIAPLTWCYLLTFAALGIALVHACRAPGRALVANAGTWLLLVLVVPQGLDAVATAWASAPPTAAFEVDRQEAHTDQLDALHDALGARLSAGLDPEGTGAEQDAQAVSAFASVDAEYAESMLRARTHVDRMEADHDRLVRDDRRVASWLARLTPSTAFAGALTEVSGTGLSYVESWESAVRRYNQALNHALFDNRPVVNLTIGAPRRDSLSVVRRHSAPRLLDLPVFETPLHSRVQKWRAGLANLAALTAHTLIALLAAAWFQRRTLYRYRRLLLSAPDSGRSP